jgi:hypothetical protein
MLTGDERAERAAGSHSQSAPRYNWTCFTVTKVQTLTLRAADLRAELAERNKQRERYRFLVAQVCVWGVGGWGGGGGLRTQT